MKVIRLKPYAPKVIIFIISLSFFIVNAQAVQNTSYKINSQGVIKERSKLSWLHTDGRYIKDEYNNIVQLRGFAFSRPNNAMWYEAPSWGQPDGSYKEKATPVDKSFDLMANTGANFIRLGFNPWAWAGVSRILTRPDGSTFEANPVMRNMERGLGNSTYILTTEDYKKNMDHIVEEFAKRGIYVIMDLHSGGFIEVEWWQNFIDNYYEIYLDVWRDIFTRYKDQPAVAFAEIMNEPRSFYNDYPYEGYWWDFNLDVAREIHKINPSIIVIVASSQNKIDGRSWGPEYGSHADAGYKLISDEFRLNPLPEPNIAYVFHVHYQANSWYSAQFDYVCPLGPETDVYNTYVSGDNEGGYQKFEVYLKTIAFNAIDQLNAPIINTEFNVKTDIQVEETWERVPYDPYVVANDYMNLMNEYGIHWTWWSWTSSSGYPWDYDDTGGSPLYKGLPSTNYPDVFHIWPERLTVMGQVISTLITEGVGAD